ncbi:hypothetical protein VP01_4496g3 [Puccinia sorghi]|uniref:Uncharacterized protein n=1 Tax=Puccinia sorghi TaxID=27349 RepID=A0A0L6UPZ4_9BASI|nr:hypothetical protein VP01_4496g3 [Puccinia sorghi]
MADPGESKGWELIVFSGDPNFIKRQFGGNVPHSCEKATNTNSDDVTQAQPKPEVAINRFVCDVVSCGENNVPNYLGNSKIKEGPAHNTRSQAGTSLRGRGSLRTLHNTGRSVTGCSLRRISKKKSAGGKANKNVRAGDTNQLDHITKGMVAFLLYSNRQTEGEREDSHFGPPMTGVNAGQWAHPVAHTAKKKWCKLACNPHGGASQSSGPVVGRCCARGNIFYIVS